MAIEYIFVSCDIIAHSSEPSLERQRDNIAAINRNELKLPAFLNQFKFVDLRSGINDAVIKELLWGITGIKSN